MSVIRDVFTGLVQAFHDINLSDGQRLHSDTHEIQANPRLVWRTGAFDVGDWQPPFIWQVRWSINATLTIQGESGEPGIVQDAIVDLMDWCSQIYGLPVDEAGAVVPKGERFDRLAHDGKVFAVADRLVGPYITKINVRPGEGDNSYSVADLTFYVEFLVDNTPKAISTAQTFTLGANIDPAHTRPQDASNYTFPVPYTSDTRTQGHFSKPDTFVSPTSFPPLVKDIPSADGPLTDQAIRSIQITPASATVAGTATKQLDAIGTRADFSTFLIARSSVAWSSSNGSAATVSAAGLVTGVAPGTTTITATYQGNSATASVTVSGVLSYTNTVLADSPLIWWRMSDAAGPTLADTMGLANATLESIASTDFQQPPLTTEAGQFSIGARSQAEFGFVGNLPNIPAVFTVEWWATNTAGRENSLYIQTDTLDFVFVECTNVDGSGTMQSNATITSIPAGTFTSTRAHYVVYHDGNHLFLYKNGSRVAFSNVQPSLSGTVLTQFVFGVPSNGFYSGNVDEVALYAGVLAGSRITAHYNAGIQ